MSSSGNSIVGHRIQVISKAQIRYEGTLYSIRRDDKGGIVLVLCKGRHIQVNLTFLQLDHMAQRIDPVNIR